MLFPPLLIGTFAVMGSCFGVLAQDHKDRYEARSITHPIEGPHNASRLGRHMDHMYATLARELQRNETFASYYPPGLDLPTMYTLAKVDELERVLGLGAAEPAGDAAVVVMPKTVDPHNLTAMAGAVARVYGRSIGEDTMPMLVDMLKTI